MNLNLVVPGGRNILILMVLKNSILASWKTNRSNLHDSKESCGNTVNNGIYN
ncbi:hypothetical protein [Methanosarcina barkeri]|uniref:hypothetical protein n=1 Tax=Methanosarcina barkeri TaxID=2208 RepID=UPI000AC621C4|nr:hypothetical protein [Methanosarcina barkeri]